MGKVGCQGRKLELLWVAGLNWYITKT
eukprot:COSAG02_NODE_45016_length_361_cov_0.587786_1_plen_27_part_01